MAVEAGQDILAAHIQNVGPIGAVTAYAGIGTPTASVIAIAGVGTATGAWLWCTGSAVSRTVYATLFAVIGTAFGAGDGSTTFNLPDLRGRIPLGAGTGAGDTGSGTGTPTGTPLSARVRGQWGGEESHALVDAENGPHTHSITLTGASDASNTVGALGNSSRGSASTGSSGSGTPHNNVQPYVVLNFIIRASYT